MEKKEGRCEARYSVLNNSDQGEVKIGRPLLRDEGIMDQGKETGNDEPKE